MLFIHFGNSQISISNFQEKSIAWIGIDFSMGKFIGAHGFKEPDNIKNHYFDEWNYLVVRETELYNIKSAFKIKDVVFEIGAFQAVNKEIDMGNFIQEDVHKLNETQIKEGVTRYNFSDIEQEVGIGFVVQTFNKNIENAIIWVIFVELKTNTLFFARQLECKPKGFGFRNYWAGAIKMAIQLCSSNLSKWKKGK